MSYWKAKVLPKIKKFFDKGKRKGASEACKSFDSSKESLEKEIGEKTPDLHPKIIEIYRSSTVIIKKLLKEPNEPAVKENPDAAQNILQELAKAGFPGAQVLSDAGGKFGPALLPGPIVYLFEKTSTFLVEEPLPEVKEEKREIPIEGVETTSVVEEEAKESEGKVDDPPQPPPIEKLASEEEKGVTVEEKKEEEVATISEDKKDVTVEEKKEEVVTISEEKKEELSEIPPPVVAEKVEGVVTP